MRRAGRKIGFLLSCVTALCGFGPSAPYDSSALPAAAAARQHKLNQCQAQSASFKTVRASVDCGLAAHRIYAMTEKLRDMAGFNAYAAQVRHIADGIDAGRIAPTDGQKQSAAARAAYEGKVAQDYAAWQTLNRKPGPPFDQPALAGAAAAHDRAVKACGAWSARDVVEARTACVLAAGKDFTTAIKLQDMDLFYGYAAVLRVDAADTGDGKREPAQMVVRQTVLWGDFLRTLNQDYANWQHAAKPASR